MDYFELDLKSLPEYLKNAKKISIRNTGIISEYTITFYEGDKDPVMVEKKNIGELPLLGVYSSLVVDLSENEICRALFVSHGDLLKENNQTRNYTLGGAKSCVEDEITNEKLYVRLGSQNNNAYKATRAFPPIIEALWGKADVSDDTDDEQGAEPDEDAAKEDAKREYKTVSEAGLRVEVKLQCLVQENSDEDSTNKKSAITSELQRMVRNGRRQIILNGAPGTGKSYTAKQLARFMVFPNGEIPAELEKNPELRKAFLFDQTFPAEQYDPLSIGENPDDPESRPDVIAEDAYLKEKVNAISPDTLSDPDTIKKLRKIRGHIAQVQFHPSYDYSDFVEGLRPVEKGDNISFHLIDGSFKSFCRFVAWRNEKIPGSKDELYFFLIDEINRADLPKVFGELMYCMEEDKRSPDFPTKTQYQNMPTYFPERNDSQSIYYTCFDRGFYIPKNVVIIGTMNDIDRSVESMDFALRRRFMWKEIRVDEKLLKEAFKNGFFNDSFFDDELFRFDVPERIDESEKNFKDAQRDAANELNKSFCQIRDNRLASIQQKLCEMIADTLCRFNDFLHKECNLTSDYDIAQGHFTGLRFSVVCDEAEKNKAGEDSLSDLIDKYLCGSINIIGYFREHKDEVIECAKLLANKKITQTNIRDALSEILDLPKAPVEETAVQIASQIFENIMKYVWKYRVKSLLVEYLRGQLSGEDLNKKLDFLEKCWKENLTEEVTSHV